MKKFKTLEYDKKYNISVLRNHFYQILTNCNEESKIMTFELLIAFLELCCNDSDKYSVHEIIDNFELKKKQIYRKAKIIEIEKTATYEKEK